MPGIAHSDCIDPKRLASSERQAFAESLFDVHCAVFDGVPLPEFTAYVVESSAEITRILRFKNAAGAVVGYFALHIFERTLGGRTIAVFMAEAGMLRKYRGGASTLGFALREFLAYKLRHPTRPTCYLDCLVHPSSYSLFAGWSGNRLWPNPERSTPHEELRFMNELGDQFQFERVDPSNPLVRASGWKTRDSEVEREYWRSCQKPAALFFLQQNPRYAEGTGLLTLMPLDAGLLRSMATRYFKQVIGPALVALGRRCFGRPLDKAPASTQVVEVLRAAPLLRPLSDAALTELAGQMEIRHFGSGQPVIRKGETGDAMYVVYTGSAYIVIDDDGEEVHLDRMTAGDVFGEMALLTGEPRSTTVRAAGALTVLRLARGPFQVLLSTSAELRDSIWDAYVQRTLRSHLSALPRFNRLSLAARNDYIAMQQRVELRPGEPVEFSHEGLVFLATGGAEVLQGNSCVVVRAPTLLPSTGPTRLSSAQGAMAARLPSLDDFLATRPHWDLPPLAAAARRMGAPNGAAG